MRLVNSLAATLVTGALGAQGEPAAPVAEAPASAASQPWSSKYANRVISRIRPNIVFGELVEGNPTAVIKVTLRADGEVIEAELVKSSGNAGWDNAVRTAVLRARQMPRDVDGRVPPMLIISFKPH